MQQTLLPPVIEDNFTDTTKEPQYVKIRSNNTACLYVNDIASDGTSSLIENIGPGLFFVGCKRLKVQRMIVTEDTLNNITDYNHEIAGYFSDAPGVRVSFNVDRGYVPPSTDPTLLAAWLQNSAGKPARFTFEAKTLPLAPPNTVKTSYIKLTITGGVTWNWDRTCSFYKNGAAMFGLQDPTPNIGDFKYDLLPGYRLCWYIDVISNTLTKWQTNRNLTTSSAVTNIVYRYYMRNTSVKDSSYWLNWNKAGLDRFDLQLLDPQGNPLQLSFNGASFISMEILMEQ